MCRLLAAWGVRIWRGIWPGQAGPASRNSPPRPLHKRAVHGFCCCSGRRFGTPKPTRTQCWAGAWSGSGWSSPSGGRQGRLGPRVACACSGALSCAAGCSAAPAGWPAEQWLRFLACSLPCRGTSSMENVMTGEVLPFHAHAALLSCKRLRSWQPIGPAAAHRNSTALCLPRHAVLGCAAPRRLTSSCCFPLLPFPADIKAWPVVHQPERKFKGRKVRCHAGECPCSIPFCFARSFSA